jgi:hypothetical protein
MGVYVYTVRARSIKIAYDGQVFDANLMMFASRMMHDGFGCFSSDDERKRYQLYLNRLDRAEATAKNLRSGYVVLAHDDADGKPIYNGASVYRGMDRGVWYDTDAIAGELVGYLVKRGRHWTVVSTHDWIEEGKRIHGEGNYRIPQRYRNTVEVPGSVEVTEHQFQTINGRWVDDIEEAYNTYLRDESARLAWTL